MARKRLSGPKPEFLEGDSPSNGPRSMVGTAPIAQVAAEAATQSALQDVVDDMNAARRQGRMVLDVPLDQIAPDHLARDRVASDPVEMAALKDSIRAHGQRTPIEATEISGPHPYGLISGWRRFTALGELYHETGEARFATVQVLLRAPVDAAAAYVSMVEENEIRVGLSYYERARVAAEAVKRGVFETEKTALQTLFATASRPKRSRIKSFITLYRAFDDVLRFPAAIPERLGLSLVERLKKQPDLGPEWAGVITQAAPDTAEAELALLGKLARPAAKGAPRTPASAPQAFKLPSGLAVSFRPGRIEIKGEAASEALYNRLKTLLRDMDS